MQKQEKHEVGVLHSLDVISLRFQQGKQRFKCKNYWLLFAKIKSGLRMRNL